MREKKNNVIATSLLLLSLGSLEINENKLRSLETGQTESRQLLTAHQDKADEGRCSLLKH